MKDTITHVFSIFSHSLTLSHTHTHTAHKYSVTVTPGFGFYDCCQTKCDGRGQFPPWNDQDSITVEARVSLRLLSGRVSADLASLVLLFPSFC